MKLMIGSKNPDKVKEIKEILKQLNVEFELFSMADFPDLPDVVEDKDTIEGNAIKKATELADYTGMPTIADDTGFFVDALDGAPGVYAARFAGENCTYRDNRVKVLELLKDEANRKAVFRTVVAFAEPGKLIGTAKGEVTGDITHTEFGTSGFGYDSIFRLKETGKTFGEMLAQQKHGISHRGRALSACLSMLKEYYHI
jgi:XTP/dITP diphosphohydrolase